MKKNTKNQQIETETINKLMMKTFLLLLTFTLSNCLASQALNLTTTDNGNTTSMANDKITFTVYGEIPTAKVDYAESHFLGEPVESKWNTFLKNYTQVSQQSIGFSSTNVQFNKPVIYNAVRTVNKYIKKSLKKGLITKENATLIMEHVLDCANVACFESDTKNFEKAINNAKTREDLIKVFKNTKLVYM